MPGQKRSKPQTPSPAATDDGSGGLFRHFKKCVPEVTAVIQLDRTPSATRLATHDSVMEDFVPPGQPDPLPPREGTPAAPSFDEFVQGLTEEMALLDKQRTEADQQEGQQQTPFSPKEEKYAEALESASEDGDTTSALYQKMMRSMGEQEKQKYKGLSGDTLRKQYRAEWMAKELGNLRCKKKFVKSWRDVDVKKGEYICLEVLMEKYGFQVCHYAGASRARTYAQRCCKMGGKWLKFDSMADCWLVLYIRHEHSEVFEQAWTMCSEYSDNCSVKATEAVTTEQGGAAAPWNGGDDDDDAAGDDLSL